MGHILIEWVRALEQPSRLLNEIVGISFMVKN